MTMLNSGSFDADVFISGGGPAGLVAAVAARRAGFTVVLADAASPPIDKCCGEGLMPESLAAAAEIGIQIPSSSGHRFRGIAFRGAAHAAVADFPDGCGLGIRRTALQPLLVSQAAAAGVELLWRTPVTGLAANTVSLGKAPLRARWIVGADGSQSNIRRWSGLEKFRRNTQRFSFRRHYRIAPWSQYMEIYWGKGCQFYVTPINSQEICLALMTRNRLQRIADALPHFPELYERLRHAEPANLERGAIGATRTLSRVTAENVALVGDASGTVDPITGEGMCLAFKQAVALSSAFAEGDLAGYAGAHSRIALRPRFMADFMLLMDRSESLQKRTLAGFARHPALFRNLLSMHVGELRPHRVAATAAALGFALLTA